MKTLYPLTFQRVPLGLVIRNVPISNAPIKGEMSREPGERLAPAFSASGQDVWMPEELAQLNNPALVISAVGARCGKVFKQESNEPWGVVANTAVYSPGENSDLTFLWYQVNDENFWVRGGSAQPYVQFDRSLQQRIFLPPLETQQRIANYLDRETAEIDAAVADLDKYVELLNVKLESASREVFTELSANHPLIQTKFLVDITTGSGDTQDSQENGGFPFYVRSDTIQWAEDFEFDCDAVLTSGDGAGVGKIFHLAGGKFKAHQRVYVMHNFKRVSPQYFYWMFKSAFPDAIRYGGAKSTVDSVRRPMIANLKIPVPDHDAQEKASKRIEELHHEVSALIAKSTKLRDLLLKRRSVLITEVVTGRKRV